MKNSNALANLFLERSKFLLIGLTGRTGSGCTTAANILREKNPIFPEISDLRYKGESFYAGLDARRYDIVKKYAAENWRPFFYIKVSDLISAYLMTLTLTDLSKFIVESSTHDDLRISGVKKRIRNGVYNDASMRRLRMKLPRILCEKSYEVTRKSEVLRVLAGVKKFTEIFKQELDEIQAGLYVETYQAAGNSIRKVGAVSSEFKCRPFDPDKVFELPKAINKFIKSVRAVYEESFIVIDAIRNPYEARFFKDRYSAFYLVSINAPDEDREDYLSSIRKFNKDQIKKIDDIESGKYPVENDDFVSQNVKKCIEISDIHLFNPRNERDNNNILKSQLAWYVALMVHPGLITPSSMERVMQIAYTAKTNSGCISRQVGAVVTDSDSSIKAVGWNDVPHGQVPCALRSVEGVIRSFDDEVYSEYERNNKEFREKIIEVSGWYEGADLKGRNLSYCFKDVKNSVDGKGNQVHTRSLHAEENAFLQISKYGGMSVQGGSLFTTASPCELCAKKAFQLGVERIVYIDPYPGITKVHVLANGSLKPKLVQFRGAVGRGYFQLYEQALPYKDELEYFENGGKQESGRKKDIMSSIETLEKEGLINSEEVASFMEKIG
ncbi:anti-phage dCTP deaminase [Modicisalibacter coralii]|uniref:anti-phage dCTP deaminase n=1 Tax=Modicisalibacter coralii TaxID=2304602 RepID=UPI00100B1757|nr:anti-phage dCTP deaminase [Halomonas coralii]